MKKIRNVNGRPVAYIQRLDIKTLHACKDFIRKEIFTEPDIVNMVCDTEGYYRISDPENVAFIANLGYILDYDTYSQLSPEELGTLADAAMAERHKIEEIIRKLCTYKQKLTRRERQILENAHYLKNHYDDIIEHNVLDASLENTMFCAMEQALFAQMRNYITSLIKLAEQPALSGGTSKKKRH